MKNFKFLNVTLVIVLMTTILTGCGSKNVSKSTQPITLKYNRCFRKHAISRRFHRSI